MGWFSPDATLVVAFYDHPERTTDSTEVSVSYSRPGATTEQVAEDFAAYTVRVLGALGDGQPASMLQSAIGDAMQEGLSPDRNLLVGKNYKMRFVTGASSPTNTCSAEFNKGKAPTTKFSWGGEDYYAPMSCIAWLQSIVQGLPPQQLNVFSEQLRALFGIEVQEPPSPLEVLLRERADALLARAGTLRPEAGFMLDWVTACTIAGYQFWKWLLIDQAPADTDDAEQNVFGAERERLDGASVSELFRLYAVRRLHVFCAATENHDFIAKAHGSLESLIEKVFIAFDLTAEHRAIYDALSDPDAGRRSSRFFSAVAERAFGLTPDIYMSLAPMMAFNAALGEDVKGFMNILSTVMEHGAATDAN